MSLLNTRLQNTRHPLERLRAARGAIATAEFSPDHRWVKTPLSPVVRRWHFLVVEKHEQMIPLLLQPTPDQSLPPRSGNRPDPAPVADPPTPPRPFGGPGPARKQDPAWLPSTLLCRRRQLSAGSDAEFAFTASSSRGIQKGDHPAESLLGSFLPVAAPE